MSAFGWIGDWISGKFRASSTPKPPIVIRSSSPDASPSGLQFAAYKEARSHIGWEENKNRAALRDFIAKSGIKLDPVDLPWCAAYANGCCAAVGAHGTGSAMARSFLGSPMKRTYDPKEGDFVIFWRVSPTSESGHVAFFVRFSADGKKVLALGGNQNNSVCEEWHDASRVIGFTRLP